MWIMLLSVRANYSRNKWSFDKKSILQYISLDVFRRGIARNIAMK